MKKLLVLLASILFFVGCTNELPNKTNIDETEKIPYEKFTLNDKGEEIKNVGWEEVIKNSLITDKKINSITTDRLIKEGQFKEYNIELAGQKKYDDKEYNYKMSADIVMWQSNEYFTICEIKNKKIESMDENIDCIMESYQEVWVSGIEELKVFPINEIIEFEMGTSVSFLPNNIKDENKKIGPFTIVYKVNISSPSSQVLV